MKKAIICFVVLCCLGLAAFQYSNYAASIYGSLTANHCIKAGPGSNQIQDSGSACASGGTGNVTNSGTLTSTAILTGAGTTVVQAPSANSTLDSSGNVSFAGTLAALGHVTVEGVTSTGATGTGLFAFGTSPTFITPTLGAATATSINKIAITAPASSATLTIADGKTFTVNGTSTLNGAMTVTGSDSQTYTFPATTATIAGIASGQTLSNKSMATFTMSAAGQHIQLSGASSDLAGTIAISSATSAAKSFTTAYTSAPACVITPITDPTAVGVWWVTTSTSAVTANIKVSGSITFNYVCIANPT